MSAAVTGRCQVTLLNVSVQSTEKMISKLINTNIPYGLVLKLNPGHPFYVMGREVQSIFITLDKPESVNELMTNRSNLKLNGELLRIIRTLPKTESLYNQCVTGLKIKLHLPKKEHLPDVKLIEWSLRNYFEHFGVIRHCCWTNPAQTEALFTFEDYDNVDRIMLDDPSRLVKGVNISLEKARTPEDCIMTPHPYVIHVTNLPIRVTSEEISEAFHVPIVRILLYPCFWIEQTNIINGRRTSEAWITNFSDEKTPRALAQEKADTFIRTNRIQCIAMPELINNEELCENFGKGQCVYPVEKCNYKHSPCSEPDTCNDEYCWYGHTNKRTTVSVKPPHYRSEEAPYRVKFSNLPANITHDNLMGRLKLDAKSSSRLILQPTDGNSNSPTMAYLIRQPCQNELRRQIDRWHNTPFSTQKIQCQLEMNQEYFEWNDYSNEKVSSQNTSRCSSPIRSNHSGLSNRSKQPLLYSSVASANSQGQNVSRKPCRTLPKQIQQSQSVHPQNATRNTLRSISVISKRQAPVDLSSLSTKYRWTNQTTPDEEFYWLDIEPSEERNVAMKIHVLKANGAARIHAENEQIALTKLTKLSCVPQLLHSNVKSSEKELWNIMKLIDGQRLSDYIKSNKVDLRGALQLTQRILNIIKQIHKHNIVHRDIQPKNILVGQEQHVMLINFSSAWIKDQQQMYLTDGFSHQLGNQFYRMPQFEIRENDIERNEDDQHSPTIDTTGVCAILFWLITGHEPKESQDISGKSPHQLRDHPKIIEKKILEITGFQMETKLYEHLQRHLMYLFDRSFGKPNEQWRLVELDYQLRFILALIDGEKNCLPPLLSSNTDNQGSPPEIPLGDSFVYVVSLVHHLKKQFMARHSKYIRWSNEEGNRWWCGDGLIKNDDLLIFTYQTKNLSINIHWYVRIFKEQQFSIDIKAKANEKIDIQLPLGRWTINKQSNDFDIYLKTFETEMKILISILFQSLAS